MTHRFDFLCVASVITLAVASPAAAQEAPVDVEGSASGSDAISAPAPDEIIVTAQKRSERLADVPMSITAANGAQLLSRGVTSTDDLGKLVPGFSFQKSNYGLPVYFIRGVGFFDTTLGVSPAVTVYTDQIPLPFSPMSRGAVLDLERVEVLKGPQGTLFGQNSTGGAINYIAAKPTRQLEMGTTLTIGRFNEVDAEAYVSGPLSDTLSFRIAGRHEYQDPWQRNYQNGDRIGQKDFSNGRLIVDFRPADTMRFEIMVSGWKDRSDTQQQQLVRYLAYSLDPRPPSFPTPTFPTAPNDPRAAAWDPGRDFRRDDSFYQVSLRGDIDITDSMTLTSLSSYERFKTNLPQDLDATSYPADVSNVLGTINSVGQELRLAGSFGSGFKWMIGGNYQHDKVDESFFQDPSTNTGAHIGPFDFAAYYIDNLQKIDTKSAFASLDAKMTETLTLQGSVRYTDQNRDFAGCARDGGNGTLAAGFSFLSTLLTGIPQTIAPGACSTLSDAGFPLPIVTGKLDQNNVAWRGSLNYKPLASTLLYMNITKGYKAGSFPTLPAAVASQFTPVPQESVLAYEIGAKLDLLDHKLQINGAGFYYDYRKKQLLGYKVVQPFGSIPSLVSIPKSRIWGAEFDVTLRPFSGFRLSGGGSYLNTKILRDPINPTGPLGDTGSFVGESFPFTPKWQGVVDAEYRMPVAGGYDIYVGGSVTARTGTQGTLFVGNPLESDFLIPGYALLDLRAGIAGFDDRWRIEIWGRNVTNKFYILNATRVADYNTRFAGNPATFGLTVSYNFHQ